MISIIAVGETVMIYATSAEGKQVDEVELIANGCDGYLKQPIQASQVLDHDGVALWQNAICKWL